MPHFTPNQRAILNALYVARRPLNTNEIAERTGMAWETARDNLSDLFKAGYVHGRRDGNRIYWWLK